MYNAPAVTYPVGRSQFQTGVTLAVVLVGAVAQSAWWLQSSGQGLFHGLGALLWLLAGSWAVWTGLRTPLGQLVWDGQDWRWQVGAATLLVTPRVILDGQHSLLLCLQPLTKAAVWVWPAQRVQPERWLALRRALFNPAARGAQPDALSLPPSPER